MYFQHSDDIWRDFPALAAGAVVVGGVTPNVDVTRQVQQFAGGAGTRLRQATEGELPEIRAWRRTFSAMGLKPTQYRCASESLLRRYRKEGSLPRIHPLVDLCNAISLAFAIPVAALDTSTITDYLEVRYATGDEEYLTFGGEVEHPEPGEVTFADGAGRAHARRWTNRQSGYSAVRDTTTAALIVTEGVHESAHADVRKLVDTIADELPREWDIADRPTILSRTSPRLTW